MARDGRVECELEPSIRRPRVGSSSWLARSRPPVGVRACTAVLALGACAFATALMISDRAPGVLVDVFGDTARQLWDRVDASQRARLATDGALPEEDFVVHAVVWAAITGLVALAIWTWTGLVVAIVGVFGFSVVVELAQGSFSSTRSVESVDIVANGVGVVAGAAAATVVLLGWSVVAAGVAATRRA